MSDTRLERRTPGAAGSSLGAAGEHNSSASDIAPSPTADRPNTTKSRLLQSSGLSGARLSRTPIASRHNYDLEDDDLEENDVISNASDSYRDSPVQGNREVDELSTNSFLITELRDQGQTEVKDDWGSLGLIRSQQRQEEAEEEEEDYDTDLEIEERGLADHDPTGRTMYAEICEKLGVVPVSYFLRHITDPVIVMRHHGLGPRGARAIAKILKSIVTCEKLDLSANWIEGGGGRYMTKVFQENDYIHEVRLADNRLGSEGARYICKMLHENATLRCIDLSGNGFSDLDAKVWAEAIEENKYCKQLNLSRNYFADEGGVILGPAIASNDILEVLDLSWNQIRERGGVSIARGLKENIRIKVCNLSWNGLGTRGGQAIADALITNEALTDLDLSGNRIDTGIAENIVKAVAKNELLKVLRLGCNPISTAACVSMVGFLTKSDITVLELLDLTDVPVEYNYLKGVESLHKLRPDFREIHGAVMRSGNTQADVGKPGINPMLLTNPLLVLREHIVINDTKIMDVLEKYDTDKSYTVTKDEFATALQEIGVPLDREHLNDLSERLAKTEDGRIFYGDVLQRLQPQNKASGRSPNESPFRFTMTTKPSVPVEQ